LKPDLGPKAKFTE